MEIVMDPSFELIDLGDAKEETRWGRTVPPSDGIDIFMF
jgi:hypothetical protein